MMDIVAWYLGRVYSGPYKALTYIVIVTEKSFPSAQRLVGATRTTLA